MTIYYILNIGMISLVHFSISVLFTPHENSSYGLLAFIIMIYSCEYKDQNDPKKKSKCEITFFFYFKASENILSRKNKDIKVNFIILKYKSLLTYFNKVKRIIIWYS